MHAILSTMGTSGDVLPYVGLGAALRRAGHRVTLVAPEPYAPLAQREGLGFEPAICQRDHLELLGHPDFWRPLKGPTFTARWCTRFLEPHYRLLSGLAQEGDSVLVSNPGILAARVVHEKLGRPLATLLFQSWMIKSDTRPPIMPAGLSLPRWAPRPVKWLYWCAVDAVGDRLMARELNAFRATLGLMPVKRVLQWMMSPQLMLGMFPAWFGDPQADWPPQVRLTGFPMYDGDPDGALPGDLEDFLAAGEPPIAITFGTGVMNEPDLYGKALEACGIIGRRAVVVTRYADQLPSPLPAWAMHVPFARFRSLFPRCAAVIHHGGVGTIAEALAAGVPQLVLPISWDQEDNAIRVRELGAGDWVGRRRRTAGRIADALSAITSGETKRPGLGVDGEASLREAVRYLQALAAA